jgi:hypothetical protein
VDLVNFGISGPTGYDVRFDPSAIHVNLDDQIVFAILESIIQVDVHGKRGAGDGFDVRQRIDSMFGAVTFGLVLM